MIGAFHDILYGVTACICDFRNFPSGSWLLPYVALLLWRRVVLGPSLHRATACSLNVFSSSSSTTPQWLSNRDSLKMNELFESCLACLMPHTANKMKTSSPVMLLFRFTLAFIFLSLVRSPENLCLSPSPRCGRMVARASDSRSVRGLFASVSIATCHIEGIGLNFCRSLRSCFSQTPRESCKIWHYLQWLCSSRFVINHRIWMCNS